MKQRQLIKVVATCISGTDGSRLQTTTARGISLLKRGQDVMAFTHEFLSGRGITTYSLHQRSDGGWATSPMMFLDKDPKQVITFHFHQFDLSDLGFFAKDLTPEELERDIKPLRKLLQKD